MAPPPPVVTDKVAPKAVPFDRVPGAMTRGKDRVTVTFQSQPDTTAGALIEVRTVR
jgi:hypothetical protein